MGIEVDVYYLKGVVITNNLTTEGVKLLAKYNNDLYSMLEYLGFYDDRVSQFGDLMDNYPTIIIHPNYDIDYIDDYEVVYMDELNIDNESYMQFVADIKRLEPFIKNIEIRTILIKTKG